MPLPARLSRKGPDVDLLTEPAPAPFAPAPAPGTAADLAELVAGIAADPGRWRHLAPAGDGWSVHLPHTGTVEVTLVAWAPGESTRAHDHGGASSAWAVVE